MRLIQAESKRYPADGTKALNVSNVLHLPTFVHLCLRFSLQEPSVYGPAATRVRAHVRARVRAGTSSANNNNHGARALSMSSRLPIAPDTDAPKR